MKRKLFLLLCALLTMIGVQAQKSNLTPEKGWSQITELPSGLNNYFFSLYTHTDDYAMVYGEGSNGKQGTGKYTMKYTSGVDANSNYNALWKVEAHTASQGTVGNVAFRNVEGDSRTLQTEWNAAWYMHTNDQPDPCAWNQIKPEYSISDAAWTLGNGQYPSAGSIGPWSALANGEDIAANKGSGDKTLFDIFAITRGRWVQNIASEATEEDPIEITRVLDNPGAERRVNGQGNLGGLGGWTVTGSGIDTQNNNAYSKKTGTWYFQSWVGSGHIADASMSQTINNLPNGKYKLTVDAAFGGTGCSVYANNTETAIGSTEQEYSVTTSITNGTLTVGVKAVSTNSTYLRFDNFKLFYLGVDLDGYKETLNNDRTTASGLLTSVMNADVKSALQAAYDGTADVESTQSALEAAISWIEGAIANANTSIDIYTQIAAINTKAAALDAAGVAEYASTKAAYDARTLTTVEEAQTAYIAAIKAQTTAGGNWTDLIANPSFETNNTNGWTNNGNIVTQGNTSFTLKAGSYYAEFWQPNGTKSVKQTVSDMPIGSYRISAAAFARGVTSAKIFVNNNEKAVTIGADAATYSIDFTCDNGTDLEIGFEAVCTGADASWICVDNFTLTYVGSLDDGFDAAVENVTSLEGTIPTAAYNKAYAVVQKWKDDYPTTVSGFETAIAEINSAANEAATCVAPYAAYNQKHTEVQALYDVDEYEELTSGAHEALGTALTTAATNINNAENVDGINAVINTLVSAGATYAGKANPTNEAKPFDLTFMLVNPDVTSYWNGTWGIQPAGWYTDQTGGNFQVMANEEMGPGGEVFMEYWSENARTSNFSLYQKVTLDKGTYRMTGRVGLNQDTGGNNANMTFSANETNGTKIAAGPLSDQEVEFVNTADETEVKIGIKAQAGNTYRWIGINKIKLYEIPAKTYTVDETQDWDNTTSGAGDVTLKRTIKVGLNTVVFPFSMTPAEVESTFGAGSKVYVVSAYEESTENISFVTQDGILPNQPCLLKATVAGTSYDLEGRTIVAAASAAPAYVLESVSMIGSYSASTDITKDDSNYIISGGKVYLVDSDGVSMKGTRAYIKLSGSNAARELILDFDDVTAINAIEAENVKAEGLKDGKYLIGNKIVLVKNGVKYGANGQKLN